MQTQRVEGLTHFDEKLLLSDAPVNASIQI
jgi:hypothetical protein